MNQEELKAHISLILLFMGVSENEIGKIAEDKVPEFAALIAKQRGYTGPLGPIQDHVRKVMGY